MKNVSRIFIGFLFATTLTQLTHAQCGVFRRELLVALLSPEKATSAGSPHEIEFKAR